MAAWRTRFRSGRAVPAPAGPGTARRGREGKRVLAGVLLDERGDGLGLGHVDRVAGGNLGDGGPGALGHRARCAGGGIIRSSVVSRYQLGLIRQAASVIVPPSAFTPQGTWESAMNAACPAGRSPANDACRAAPPAASADAASGAVMCRGHPVGIRRFRRLPWRS